MSDSMRSAMPYSFMSPASPANFSATRLMITLRGSDTVYTGWPKPMTISLLGHAPADVGLGLVGRVVAFLDFQRHFVGAAVFGTAQRADGAGDARVDVRAGAGDHARGERGRVELVFGVEIERGVHGAHPARGRRTAMQQVQEMTAHGVVVGLDVDALAAVREVIPVAEHRPEARHQVIGDFARTRGVVIIGFRAARSPAPTRPCA